MGIQSYRWQGYEGEVSEVSVAATRRHNLYVMAVLPGARVVRVVFVCVVVPC
jgi:hypothetical protein